MSELRSFRCKVCEKIQGIDSELALKFSVCDYCAVSIANYFWKQSSGEWLTWTNIKSKPAAYVKKPIPKKLRWEIFARDDFSCQQCGDRKFLEVDHIHPESKGGEATPGNLQTLCKSCNTKKSDKVA